MNFLVTYSTPIGKKSIETFTYGEAKAIVIDANSKSYKDVSISPLNETACTQMLLIERITDVCYEAMFSVLK